MPGDAVLVTGASGFVGRRVATTLAAARRELLLLTRDARRVADLLGPRVRALVADLASPSTYEGELGGCSAVVHAARSRVLEREGDVTAEVAATARLLDAARSAGLRRFVHLSTISVYGHVPEGELDESAPRRRTGGLYVESKIRIEEAVLRATGALEVVVLQPGCIYGPGSSWWSGALLDLMRRGTVLLVEGGAGTANLVHVDDVARAVALALETREGIGQCFIVTDGAPISWRVYFEQLEKIAGRTATLPVTVEEARRLSRALEDRSLLARVPRALSRRLLGAPLVFPLTDEAIEGYACRASFSIGRARRVLGYAPGVALAAGLESVRAARA